MALPGFSATVPPWAGKNNDAKTSDNYANQSEVKNEQKRTLPSKPRTLPRPPRVSDLTENHTSDKSISLGSENASSDRKSAGAIPVIRGDFSALVEDESNKHQPLEDVRSNEVVDIVGEDNQETLAENTEEHGAEPPSVPTGAQQPEENQQADEDTSPEQITLPEEHENVPEDARLNWWTADETAALSENYEEDDTNVQQELSTQQEELNLNSENNNDNLLHDEGEQNIMDSLLLIKDGQIFSYTPNIKIVDLDELKEEGSVDEIVDIMKMLKNLPNGDERDSSIEELSSILKQAIIR